ncbi:hypothetical protein [Hyphomonas oceanitis]|nr:hypothetical protein [Hyphomonas oceanitis]
MYTNSDDHQEEFLDLIELGSVSEETRGQPNGLIEFFGQSSRD